MGFLDRIERIGEKYRAAVEEIRKPKVSKTKNYFSSLPTELQLGIVRHLPRTSLPMVCRLNKHWHSVGTDELIRRLLPLPPALAQPVPRTVRDPKDKEEEEEPHSDSEGEDEEGEDQYDIQWPWGIDWENDDEDTLFYCNRYRSALRERAIYHHLDYNNVDALRHLTAMTSEHSYFCPRNDSLLLDEPASLRAQVTEEEEKRFCLTSDWAFASDAVQSAFKHNDMSCIQLLVDNGLVDYQDLLDEALYDDFNMGKAFSRPFPGPDSRGHNFVLEWLLAYPPRHVVQAMLIMWGHLPLHDRLLPLRDWKLEDDEEAHDNLLIITAGHGHPASLQAIDELRMMVRILENDKTGVILEAYHPLSHALRIARGIASMWPGTPPLVAEYLQSVCTWDDPPDPNNPLILPPSDPVLHRLIDLKTYDEMLALENWQELGFEVRCHNPLPWLVSTEFLGDAEAARRMLCFKRSLKGLKLNSYGTKTILWGASAFRRWNCVEVIIDALKENNPTQNLGISELVLARAIYDAVHGEEGCADGHIVKKLIRAGVKDWGDGEDLVEARGEELPDGTIIEGGGFSWEHFRLAFVERQQDRDGRETKACMEMREAFLRSMTISDLSLAAGELDDAGKAVYQRTFERILAREVKMLKNAASGKERGN